MSQEDLDVYGLNLVPPIAKYCNSNTEKLCPVNPWFKAAYTRHITPVHHLN